MYLMECGHDNPFSWQVSKGVVATIGEELGKISAWACPKQFPEMDILHMMQMYIYIVIFIYGRMYSISYSYVVRLNDLLIHYIASNFVISILSLGFWTATPCCKDSDWTIFTRWNGEGIKSIWWKHRRKHFTAALTGNTREEIVSIILSRTWRVFVPKSKKICQARAKFWESQCQILN